MRKQEIISKATQVLYARWSGNVKREQEAFQKLMKACGDSIDPFEAIQQVEEHLKKTSVAAIMNGIV